MELWFPGSRARAFRCSRLCTCLPGFLRMNYASWLHIQSELSVIFGAAREGGRERRAGGGIEEQFSFALIACCWSGVVVAARCLALREIF